MYVVLKVSALGHLNLNPIQSKNLGPGWGTILQLYLSKDLRTSTALLGIEGLQLMSFNDVRLGCCMWLEMSGYRARWPIRWPI